MTDDFNFDDLPILHPKQHGKQPLSEGYRKTKEAFEWLWTNPGLPLDCRRHAAGMVQAAGRKQGEEVFPEEYMEKVSREEPLHPDEQIEMFNKVHIFIITNDRLRVQYLTIIVKRMIAYLNRLHHALAAEFERKLADAASQN